MFRFFSHSLRSWRDFVRECFCFGSEALNASGEAVRGLVKSRVEFPPAQISGVFWIGDLHDDVIWLQLP